MQKTEKGLFLCATKGEERKKSMFSDSRSEQHINTKKANNSELLKNKKAFKEAEYAVIHGRLHDFFPLTWPVTQSVSLEVSLFLSLPPALTPWISTGKASLSLDNNPNCHPCRHQNSRRDYNIIQGDNPVQSVVKKWGELQQPCGWVDKVGGNCKGGKCRVSLGDEAASTVLDWAVLSHKKGKEAQPIIEPTLWIFLSFFSSLPLSLSRSSIAAPIWGVALKVEAWLLGNHLNCPAVATVTATTEPPWGWRWAGPYWLLPATHF